RFSDGVTDTVVPGQTCTSPPLDRRRKAVSGPAVIAEPAPPLSSASDSGPAVRTAVTTGCGADVRLGTVGDSNGELFAWLGFFPRMHDQAVSRSIPGIGARREQ